MNLPFDRQCEAAGLPVPVAEHRFAPPRRWRWDWSWPERKLAVEVDGGLYVGGRHSRGSGQEKDMEKRNEGAALGWKLLVVSPRMVRDGRALEWVRRVLGCPL